MIEPHDNDVLFGRGAGVMKHPGNRRLRSLVERRRAEFASKLKRKEKRRIAWDIIAEVQNARPPGRFLTEDARGREAGVPPSLPNKVWVCAEPNKTLVKVMHMLREKGSGGQGHDDRRTEVPTQPQPPCQADEAGDLDKEAESLLEGHLDEEVETFLRELGDLHEEDAEQLPELTMRQWIEQSTQAGESFQKNSEYVRSALSIALKLTECLIEAERGGREAVPLASIAPRSIMIQTTLYDPHAVNHVAIRSCVGDNPETGGTMPRLAALGVVLHELFSAGEFRMCDDDAPSHDAASNLMSLNSIQLNNHSDDIDRPRKKSQQGTVCDNGISKRTRCLESIGVLRSLCALVENLLDCSNGMFCGDAAFTSYVDVRLDLELMLHKPTLFLDDIPTNPLPILTMRNELYGREYEVQQVNASYQQLSVGTCNGVLISGGAGAGKSRLAMHIQELTSRAGGYFVGAKFEQKDHVKPLSAIGQVFNTLCDLFAGGATASALASVSAMLGTSLGGQAALLAPAVPSLAKLLPPISKMELACHSIDFGLSLRFLFFQVLQAFSLHCRSISLFFDDVQWADSASLTLIASLISSLEGSNNVFFTCCHRDVIGGDKTPLSNWLKSVASLTTIKLENLTEVDVNKFVSETLHLSPRLTRPLSSLVHRKTRGNPFFLRQLMELFKVQGHIHFKLNQARWAWDLSKVMDEQLPDGVIALLINDMQRLSPDLHMSLKVASCMGSRVKYSILDVLSQDLELNLQFQLQQLSEKGFMQNDCAVSSFIWVHDKIEQAAVELMSEQERRQLHMRLGLAISSFHSWFDLLDNVPVDDEVLFVAVNQINCGGLVALSDSSKRSKIASLNLKAGKQAVMFSDFNAALKLFASGASFLPVDSWVTHYNLSVGVFDAAAEAACITNNRKAVTFYSNQLIANATCFGDRVNCLFSLAKTLRQANKYKEAMDSFLSILQQCGEELPLPMGNEKLTYAMQDLNQTLLTISDEQILKMGETNKKEVANLMRNYAEFVNLLIFIKPSLMGAVSLRMIDLTLKWGLTAVCPCAFAFYGGILVSMGSQYVNEACRLAKTALKLLERKESSAYRSNVIFIAYCCVLWASDPLQVITEALLDGYNAGMQSGDHLHSVFNQGLALVSNFLTGQSLSSVRQQFRDFFLSQVKKQSHMLRENALLYHLHIAMLQDGESRQYDKCVDGLPGLGQILKAKQDTTLSLLIKSCRVQWAFLFRRFDDISFGENNLLDVLSEEKHQLRVSLVFAVFYEGLLSFQLARQTSNETQIKWIEKGVSVLANMQCWASHCAWNYENKMLLLKAENMYTVGQLDEAAELYTRSIRSAHDHKFIHEEAIASENAADFYFVRHIFPKSVALYKHSITCYKKWGALAVAKRVENMLQRKGLDIAQLDSIDDSLTFIFASEQGSVKKRHAI